MQRKRKRAEREEEEGRRGKGREGEEAWPVVRIRRQSLEIQVEDGETVQHPSIEINAEFFFSYIITVHIYGEQCGTLMPKYVA